ncbi:MAG: DMT family transporter [Burkholderiaceae bacterium]|nr:DMT family transporter [Burkholderiaceae bacterium]
MSRKALDGQAIALMVVLCALWGMQQVAVKVAVPSINPVMQMGLRCLVAGVLLIMLMLVRREGFSFRDGRFGAGIGVGLLFSLEFLLIALGLLYTTASHMVVFLYTAPVYVALGVHFLVPGEKLSITQWLGVGLAFSGIVCAFSGGLFTATGKDFADMLLGDGLAILASIVWAATTVMIRASSLSDAPASQTLLYQLAMAAILLTGGGVIAGQWQEIQMAPIAWVSMAYQSLIVAFGSFLVWFWLLRRYLASPLSTFSFLTPLFGVTFGVILLGDPVDIWFGLGAVLVVAGIGLVSWKRG